VEEVTEIQAVGTLITGLTTGIRFNKGTGRDRVVFWCSNRSVVLATLREHGLVINADPLRLRITGYK
jgi:hypothetical protein